MSGNESRNRGVISVKNDTRGLYRFLDATPMTEIKAMQKAVQRHLKAM